MSFPALSSWIVGSLLGWIALRGLAAWAARSRRARLKALAIALTADARYGAHGRRLVAEALRSVRGNAMAAVFPILVPAALLALAWAGTARLIRRTDEPSPLERLELMRFREHELRLRDDLAQERGSIRADPRFRRLGELAFEAELLRWPLVSLLTVAMSLPVLPLYLAVYGWRESVQVLPQLGLFFARSLALLAQPSGRSGGRPGEDDPSDEASDR